MDYITEHLEILILPYEVYLLSEAYRIEVATLFFKEKPQNTSQQLRRMRKKVICRNMGNIKILRALKLIPGLIITDIHLTIKTIKEKVC